MVSAPTSAMARMVGRPVRMTVTVPRRGGSTPADGTFAPTSGCGLPAGVTRPKLGPPRPAPLTFLFSTGTRERSDADWYGKRRRLRPGGRGRERKWVVGGDRRPDRGARPGADPGAVVGGGVHRPDRGASARRRLRRDRRGH